MQEHRAKIELPPWLQGRRPKVCVMLALALGCALLALGRGCGPAFSHPPAEDAFVSYYQAAYGLASGLQQIKSREEFDQQNQNGGIDRLAGQLVAFSEAVEQLSESERVAFALKHSDLLEQTKNACQELWRIHDRNPEILGNQWEIYWNSLPFPN